MIATRPPRLRGIWIERLNVPFFRVRPGEVLTKKRSVSEVQRFQRDNAENYKIIRCWVLRHLQVLRETPGIEKYPYTYRNCHTVICLCSSYTPPNQNAWMAIYRRFVETVYTLLEARVSE